MLLALILACVPADPPSWSPLETVTLPAGGEPLLVDLLPSVEGGTPPLTFHAEPAIGVRTDTLGSRLMLAADPAFAGATAVPLTVTDGDGRAARAELPVLVGGAACPVTLTHDANSATTTAVTLAGALVDAAGGTVDFVEDEPGHWRLDLQLAPGAWSYRIVETVEFSESTEDRSYCDANARQILCPAGASDPGSDTWTLDCSQPDPPCDSLLVVPDCTVPSLALQRLDVDRAAGSLSAEVVVTPAATGAAVTELAVEIDDTPVEVTTDGGSFHVELTGLAPGRHTLRATATDADGAVSEPLWVPVWTDVDEPREGWRDGPMYFAFVDRFANGDPTNDAAEGASAEIADFAGGDWAGIRDALPYLDDLGVRTLWLSNPQDNAAGAWPGQCDADFAGYHAYWPTAPRRVEEHFGVDDDLRALVAAAHERDMRVVMDLVINHVHVDHPYYDEHRDTWFNDEALCEDADNWDDIPETCWFAPYLPDLDYSRADVMVTMLDDAMWWARTYDLDGLRVDAAKHMPHAVQINLARRVQEEIEHRDAGGDEEFWTVGETFDGADRIASYIGDDQLDGQFDFPLFYALRAAVGTRTASMRDLSATMQDSRDRYADALMSEFLGNHDVTRFITEVAWGGGDVCAGDPLARAGVPTDSSWAYDRLILAWAFVLTRPAVPLIYYGDELGIPGYGDPDNRQPLWWHVGDALTGVDDVADAVRATAGGDDPARVLLAVQALARARRDHPALWSGDETEWWLDDDVLAWDRVTDDDGALVILNAGDADLQLSNGATFAGLPAAASWSDVLTGETVSWADDRIEVSVPARGARVLVPR